MMLWDSNPGPQDGRRRWNRVAMVATTLTLYFYTRSIGYLLKSAFKVPRRNTKPTLEQFPNQLQFRRIFSTDVLRRIRRSDNKN